MNEQPLAPRPVAGPKDDQGLVEQILEILTALPAGGDMLKHRILNPFCVPYALIMSPDSAPGAGDALKKAGIPCWGAMVIKGCDTVMVDRINARRACVVLGRYGIIVLNPPEPGWRDVIAHLAPRPRPVGQPAMMPPRQAARQARGRARRPGGIFDRMGF